MRYGTVLCGRYGAVRGFAVRGVRFSSFGRLCLLISDNLSDHAVVELIFNLFRKVYVYKFCSYMNMSSCFFRHV